MEAHEIVNALIRGAFTHEELEDINRGLRVAWKNDRAERMENMQSELRGGELVRIKRIRPRTLEGCEGRVGRFNGTGTRVDVVLTDAGWTGRWTVGQTVHGIPLTCLEIVGQDNGKAKARKGQKRAK